MSKSEHNWAFHLFPVADFSGIPFWPEKYFDLYFLETCEGSFLPPNTVCLGAAV